MDRENDIKEIAKHYGYEQQEYILIEEMAELTQAILKFDRANIDNLQDTLEKFENIMEEITDVEIVLFQIKYLLSIDNEEMINKKVDRQLNRMRGK